MPSPVDLALTSLLPHVAFPPEELQHLTTSLLTQSRARAPRLKPDEEVARTFACAHLACERLQRRLSLEIGRDLRPPCAPRVYTRLKGFLAGLLDPTRRPSVPGLRSEDAVAEREGSRTPRKPADAPKTPARPPIVADGRSTVTATPPTSSHTGLGARKRKAAVVTGEMQTGEGNVEDTEDGLPSFAAPLLAYLCAACRVSGTVMEHVRIGAADVVAEIASRRAVDTDTGSAAKRRKGRSASRNMGSEESTPVSRTPVVPISRWRALLVALFLCTAAKTRGCELDTDEMKDVRTKAVAAAETFCLDEGSGVFNGPTPKSDDMDKTVTFYLLEAEDGGWLQMEWYQKVSVTGSAEAEEEDDDDDDVTAVKRRGRPAKTPLRRKEKHGGREILGDDMGPAGLLPGLGTMFQPAVDWLSDDRRAQFKQWKEETLSAIAVVQMQA